MGADEVRVVDNPDELQYELWLGQTRVGFLAYRHRADAVVLMHTEVDPAFEGQGLGSRLVEGALADLRSRGLKLVPICPFVAGYLRRHPGHEDIVIQDPVVSD
jgi:predicted GNAT family acetyltransferase